MTVRTSPVQDAIMLANHDAVDIVLHIASSHDPSVVSFLIRALGERREATGKESYFVHVSEVAVPDYELFQPIIADFRDHSICTRSWMAGHGREGHG